MSDYTALYPALSTVLSHIEASIQAEQIFCSIVTEMTYLPAFKDQPPLRQLHRENYEMIHQKVKHSYICRQLNVSIKDPYSCHRRGLSSWFSSLMDGTTR